MAVLRIVATAILGIRMVVCISNVPEEFHDLARWQNGNGSKEDVGGRIKRVWMAQAAIWLYEDFSAVSRRSASIQVAPPSATSLHHLVPSHRVLEPFRGCEEGLNQPHENASYPIPSLHRLVPSHRVSKPFHGPEERQRRPHGGSMSMSSTSTGYLVGPRKMPSTVWTWRRWCRLVLYSHESFSLPRLEVEQVVQVHFDPAMTVSVCEGPRRVYEAIGRRFWWCSCVITSTTGILSLIRLLWACLQMCFVTVDPAIVLSPQPARGELSTPIPQALSGGVLHVECPRVGRLMHGIGSSVGVLGRSGLPAGLRTSELDFDTHREAFAYLEYRYGQIPRPEIQKTVDEAVQQHDMPSEQYMTGESAQSTCDSDNGPENLPGGHEDPADSPNNCAETETGFLTPETKVADVQHVEPHLLVVEVGVMDSKWPDEGMDAPEAPDKGSQSTSNEVAESGNLPKLNSEALEPQGDLPDTTGKRTETQTGHRKPETEVVDMQQVVNVLPMVEVGTTGRTRHDTIDATHRQQFSRL
ncbi:hypothetical protein F5141DRAFT_1206105 [Pisolithus sp. B1]|nr:hypothetical protein F5141DRAFT_1206105 [Pisolithus sp. B1]